MASQLPSQNNMFEREFDIKKRIAKIKVQNLTTNNK